MALLPISGEEGKFASQTFPKAGGHPDGPWYGLSVEYRPGVAISNITEDSILGPREAFYFILFFFT